nr:fatty acid hydroxylase domain-containing protein 2 isoform X3 [Caretta caretta]
MKGDAARSTGGSRQKQAGKLWDSMKITGFILGTGLLLFAAFRNSVTWHGLSSKPCLLVLQWTPDGGRWDRKAQFHHPVPNSVGQKRPCRYFSPCLPSWTNTTCIFLEEEGRMGEAELSVSFTPPSQNLMLFYTGGWRNRIKVDPAKLRQAVHTVLFNQVFISLPMMMLMLPIMKWRGQPCSEELPTFHWFLLELSIFTLVEEILFYYSHRLVHHPLLYKRIHKKHHEWTAPIGVVSLYAHPVEHLVQSVLRSPGGAGPPAWNRHALQANQGLREARYPAEPHPSHGEHSRLTQESQVNPPPLRLARGNHES